MKHKGVFFEAVETTIPVMLGYLFVGIAFGMLFQEKGYNFLWAAAMSIFVYAGSMQFIGINFFVPGVSLVEVALMTLLVNVRHIFYGLSMIEPFSHMGRKKPYMIFSLTDETYSLLVNIKNEEGHADKLMFLISFLDQCYWIIGSILGSLIGSMLPFDTTGIDFALIALFVVIFTEQWLSCSDHRPALCGTACGLLSLVVFGAENMVIPSMILIVLVLMAMKKKAGDAS